VIDLDAYILCLKAQPDLAEALAPLFEHIEQQARRIHALEVQVADLTARLAQNSTNSHRPPSSDGYAKAPAIPRPQGGRRGGQSGHPGRALMQVARPDVLDHVRPDTCTGCGAALAEVAPERTLRRQVFDLPEPRLVVREYRREVCRCPGCGNRTTAPFPAHVTAPAQYGAGVTALATLLHSDYHVPVAKVSRLFGDLFGHRLSEATVETATRRSAAAMDATTAAIEAHLAQAAVVHVDETGLRAAGRLHWLHVLSTPTVSRYHVHRRRGSQAHETSALSRVSGCLVHDCWSSYFALHDGAHGLCNAHLVRELRALAEAPSSLDAAWAGGLVEVLLDAHRYKVTHGTVPPAAYRALKQQYFALLREGLDANPRPVAAAPRRRGRPRRGKARSLIRRLVLHHASVWRFAHESAVPFTNNQAERDLRMSKVKQKVNGGFRTEAGAVAFAVVLGFCSTARKQGLSVLAELRRALQEPNYSLLPT